MMIPAYLVGGVLLFHQVSGLRCGIPGFTKPCIGATDIRYDPDVSFDLQDQDNYWKIIPGLYISSHYRYDGANGSGETNPRLKVRYGFPKEYGSWMNFPNLMFHNITVDGSRYYHRKVKFGMHNGDQNVTAVGENIPGRVNVVDRYYASTWEKDGSVILVAGRNGPSNETLGEAGYNALFEPYQGRALYGHEKKGPTLSSAVQLSTYCTNVDCTKWNYFAEGYNTRDQDNLKSTNFVRENATQVDAETWINGIRQAYIDFNIPVSRPPQEEFLGNDLYFQPFSLEPGALKTPECVTGPCLSEDIWKKFDPKLNTSPYQEPEGQLLGWAIAVFVLIGVSAFTIFAFAVHKVLLRRQESRYKTKFVRNIARNIIITDSAGEITPETLLKQYEHIDKDKGGTISKDELRDFIRGGISENDFNMLWAAIDIDESGEVDFVEFCTFLSSCGEEFDKVYSEQKDMSKAERMQHASVILSKNFFKGSGIEEEFPED